MLLVLVRREVFRGCEVSSSLSCLGFVGVDPHLKPTSLPKRWSMVFWLFVWGGANIVLAKTLGKSIVLIVILVIFSYCHLSMCSNLILLRIMWEVDVRPWDWCQCWRCFVSWFHTNFRLRWFVDAFPLICCSPSNGGIEFLGQPDVVGLCSVPTQSCTPMCGLCSPGYVYGVWLTFEEDGIPILNCSLCQWP